MKLSEQEVAWYNIHGLHPERVSVDNNGVRYVIGDFSWNRNRLNKCEYIEAKMKSDGAYDLEVSK